MTTIKEYKAMMEGATDAPWYIGHKNLIGYRSKEDDQSFGMIIPICDVYSDEKDADLAFIAASRNIAPSLIRVIELAEEALQVVGLSYEINVQKGAIKDDDGSITAYVNQALSEIRKLKGE